MKPFLKFSAVLCFLLVALVACKKDDPDPCENVSCLNGGTCNDGSCRCAAGYEGGTCATEQRSKFLGVYNVSEACGSGNFTYTMNINTSAAGVQNVVFSNFGGYGVTVNGTINGSSITVPNQTLDVTGTSATFSGSGQISGVILTLTYTTSAGGGSETCTATCTKQ